MARFRGKGFRIKNWDGSTYIRRRAFFVLSRPSLVVVILSINLAAGPVLSLVDIPSLLGREPAAIRPTVGANLAMDVLLAIFRARDFSWGHLAAADTLRDALLLVIATVVDGAHRGYARSAMIY